MKKKILRSLLVGSLTGALLSTNGYDIFTLTFWVCIIIVSFINSCLNR